MGLFGSSNDKKEEVTLGIPENEDDSSSEGSSANVGEVDFTDESSSESESSDKLRNQVKSMNSVTGTTESSSSVSSTTSGSVDLEEIQKQNQEIIEKLDKVLSRL